MSYLMEVEVSVNPNLIGALVNLNASPLSKAHVATTVRKGGSTVLTVRVRYNIKAPLVLMGLSN